MAKIKLVESFRAEPELISPITLTEATTKLLVEGRTFRCVGAYTFAFSRPGKENLNGRVYPVELWERVIAVRGGENTLGLCDHPENEGSVKDIFCVWRNIRFSPDRALMLADCYLVGKWGQHAKDVLDAGGPVGLSSVGFGDFIPGTNIIDPATFEISRVSDWVLDPSYEVYGTAEDEIVPAEQGGPVTVPTTPSEVGIPLEAEDNTELGVAEPYALESQQSKPSGLLAEGKMENTEMKTLNESTFRLQMTGILKGLKEEENLSTKITEIKENLSYFNDETRKSEDLEKLEMKFTDLLEAAEKEVSELAGKGAQLEGVQESLAQAETTIKEHEEIIKALTEDKEKLEGDLKIATDMAESIQTVVKEKDSEISSLKNEMSLMFSADEYNALKEAKGGDKKRDDAPEGDPKKKDDDEGDDKGDDEGKKGKDDKDDGKKKKEAVTPETRTPDELEEAREARKARLAAKKEASEAKSPEGEAQTEIKEGASQKSEPTEIPEEVVPEVLAYYESRKAAFKGTEKFSKEFLQCRTVMEAQKVFMKNRTAITETNYTSTEEEKEILNEGLVERKRFGLINKEDAGLKIPSGWM